MQLVKKCNGGEGVAVTGGLEGKRRGWCVAEGRPGDGGAGQWILFVIYRRSSGCICTAGLVVGGYDDYEWRC